MKKTIILLMMLLAGIITVHGQEAYAVYNDGTLTFYYDNQRSSRQGTTYDDLRSTTKGIAWKDVKESITKVVFNSSFANARPTSTDSWFSGCKNLTIIQGIGNLNTSEVTNMSYMFMRCNSLTSLDVSHFNTAKVLSMSFMFAYCSALTSLDVSHFNTAKVERMDYVFYNCSNLTSLNVRYFNTANVSNLTGLFEGCSKLTSIDVSHFNTAKVTSMAWMFQGCSALTNLDVSNFNTDIVTDMAMMFNSCGSLTSLDLSNFNTAKVTNMNFMFYSCSKLSKLTLGNLFSARANSHTEVFDNCANLNTVTFTGDIPSSFKIEFFEGIGTPESPATLYVPEQYRANYAAKFDGNKFFGGYFKLVTYVLPPAQAETYAVYNDGTLTFYYDNQRSSRQGTAYDITGGSALKGWYGKNITKAVFDASFSNARPTSTSSWFYGCGNLKEIQGLSYLNTSEVTGMNKMFSDCSGLTTIDLTNFNTTKVTDMSNMFYGCSGLKSLDVSKFDTDNVTNMELMFYGCSSLTNLNVSNFNTAKVAYMRAMFSGCSGLTSLDVSNFNTSNVKEILTFYGCKNLAKLTLGSGLVTKEEHDCSLVFQNCSSLKTVSFTGDIPTSINSEFFSGVGTATNPATLDVPDQYRANYAAKFSGGKFFGGYFTLLGAETSDIFTALTKEGVTMTFKILSENDKTCQVGSGEEASVNVKTSGQVTIPETAKGYKVIAIGDKGFYNCANLTHIWLHENIERIGKLAFYGCTSLRVLDIPRSITYIAENAFDNCPNTTISIPFDRMEVLPSNISSGTNTNSNTISISAPSENEKPKLERIFIPRPVVEIGERTFSFCMAVKEIVVDANNSVFDSRNDCNAIIRTEDNTLLYGCQNTIIPSTVTSIASYAFEGHSNLKAIAFPASIASIGNNAFTGCTGLKTVTSKIMVPFAFDDNTFDDNTYRTATLHIPYGTMALYKATAGWKNFLNIVEQPAEAEPYVVYNNGTLTFYCDNLRSSREGDTYDLNTGENLPEWHAVNKSVTKAVFDASFANAWPTTTYRWFYECENMAEIINLYNLNTTNVTSMEHMFARCLNLTSLDLSHFDTRNVTNMWATFGACTKLTSLDLSNFDTSKVTDMSQMFVTCPHLTSLVLGNQFISTEDTRVYRTFGSSENLNRIQFTGDIPASINSKFFEGVGSATALATLDVPAEYRDHYAAKMDGNIFFGGYFNLSSGEEPKTESYVAYNNGTLTFYCDTKRNSREGTTYSLNEGYSYPEWKEHAEDVATVVFDVSFADARPVSTCNWFWGCHNLTDFQGMEHLNTSSVTKMNSMFRECTTLTKLDLSYFNTANVEDMGCMFQHCRHIKELNLSSFNTEKLIDVNCMFFDCQRLTNVNLSSFNTSNVKYFSNMFQYCYKITELDLSNFNTMNASQSFHSLFAWCNELASLKLGSGFVSTNNQDCSESFLNCRKLVNVTFTGDIPSNINSQFFEGVGTAENPATLDVPAEYRDHYAAKMSGCLFFGGYFKLSGGQPGDQTGDGEVNGTDLVALVNMIMGTLTATDGADINGDGELNGTDYVALVNIIMGTASSRRADGARGDVGEGVAPYINIGMEQLSIAPGENRELTITLENTGIDVTMAQMDLMLPKGLTLTGGYGLTSRTTERAHQLYTGSNGQQRRLMLASTTNAVLSGAAGAILRLTLSADESFDGGDIVVSNVLCTSPDLKEARQQQAVLHLAGTTGIKSVHDSNPSVHAPAYSPSGQRLTAPRKGINIIGGKKVIIK